MSERTLTILKPDSVAAGKSGAILAHLEREGFRLAGVKKIRLGPEQEFIGSDLSIHKIGATPEREAGW